MIFIDQNTPWPPSAKWPYSSVCHLFCNSKDDIEELHKVASKIGLKRSWFQSSAVMPHYDLTPNKRFAALRIKVTECTSDQFRESMQYWRENKFTSV